MAETTSNKLEEVRQAEIELNNEMAAIYLKKEALFAEQNIHGRFVPAIYDDYCSMISKGYSCIVLGRSICARLSRKFDVKVLDELITALNYWGVDEFALTYGYTYHTDLYAELGARGWRLDGTYQIDTKRSANEHDSTTRSHKKKPWLKFVRQK